MDQILILQKYFKIKTLFFRFFSIIGYYKILSIGYIKIYQNLYIVGGRDKLGDWDWQIYTTTYKIKSKDLLYSTGNSTG